MEILRAADAHLMIVLLLLAAALVAAAERYGRKR